MRKYVDCREHAGDIKCSVALVADSEGELMEAAVQHLKAVHKYEDTSETRAMIHDAIKDGTPLA